MIIPPQMGEKFRFVVGEENNERTFQVFRGSATMMNVKENGTSSPLGASNRSAGLGGYSYGPGHPASIRSWSAGTNATVSQSKFLRRVNVGDQPMADNYICYGPGTFRFWNGPNAGPEEFVEFGPIESNQVMYLRTDPRKRGVVDMTSTPNTPQALDWWQKTIKDFLTFATGNNATPLAIEIESWFGILPPQGNPYSLLKGRWSDAALIPAKSPGKPAQEYFVKCEIDDGNANSRVVVTGTPLRRLPY